MLVILDDSQDRIDAFNKATKRAFPEMNVQIFRRAPDLISELEQLAPVARVFSLDHDLEEGNPGDPRCGTGRHVVDEMVEASKALNFLHKDVIVHTSNGREAPGMRFALEEAGFNVSVVAPNDGERWIRREWMAALKEILSRH